MLPAQILMVVIALAFAVLVSESLLNLLGLGSLRLGFVGWISGIAVIALGSYVVTETFSFDTQLVRYAATGLGALWTGLWFNDHSPAPAPGQAARASTGRASSST